MHQTILVLGQNQKFYLYPLLVLLYKLAETWEVDVGW